MVQRYKLAILMMFVLLPGACTSPVRQEDSLIHGYGPVGGVSDPDTPVIGVDKSLPITVFDSYLGDLDDPAIMQALARADILITDASRFWGRADLVDDLNTIRATYPNLKVLGFYRTKCVRTSWADISPEQNSYNSELYETAKPYFSYTTEGDTLSDWPGVAVYNFLDPEVRRQMLTVFLKFQYLSGAPLDGIFWDYFNDSLWISSAVDNVIGEPDMDGDGLVHWDDTDELEAFQAASVAWIQEVRAALGEGFIQIVNGSRALTDSTFAGLVDGMFYETFPNVGYNSPAKYRDALDVQIPNNLWAAHNWPRTVNGGPWLILSNVLTNVRFTDINGDSRTLNLGDLNRAVTLLTDASSVFYDMTGNSHTGSPSVELALGMPLSPVKIRGNYFSREFENGYIELEMGSGSSPVPFVFQIHQNGELVQNFDFPIYFP